MQNFIFADILQPLKNKAQVLLLMIVCAGVFGCTTSKSFYKKGQQLQEAGLSEEATKYYYMSLQKNSNNIDSKIHLKKVAQLVLDDHLSEFYKAQAAEQNKAAVYGYKKAMAFKTNMERYVSLEQPPYYEDYFITVKSKYLDERYEKGLTLIEEGQFEQAEMVFKEISELDPLYKDVSELKKITQIEPLYNEAIANFEAKQFKEAYKKFSRVVQVKGAYKEALTYKENALSESRLTIALLPIEAVNERLAQNTKDHYYSKILSELLNGKNEFIQFIDRANTQKIIDEQKLGLSGLIDEEHAAKTGELLGAKIVISGKLIKLNTESEPLKTTAKQGFKAVRVKKYNAVGKYHYYATEYKRTLYKETHGKNTVNTSFQFQMISSETGEVLISEVFNLSKTDRVDYAEFEGDHRTLYAGKYGSKSVTSNQDQVYSSVAQKQALDKMLMSRHRKLKSTDQIREELIDEIAIKMARKIDQFEKGR